MDQPTSPLFLTFGLVRLPDGTSAERHFAELYDHPEVGSSIILTWPTAAAAREFCVQQGLRAVWIHEAHEALA